MEGKQRGEQKELFENDLDDLLLPYKIDLSVFHLIENQDLTEHINRVGMVFNEKEQE